MGIFPHRKRIVHFGLDARGANPASSNLSIILYQLPWRHLSSSKQPQTSHRHQHKAGRSGRHPTHPTTTTTTTTSKKFKPYLPQMLRLASSSHSHSNVLQYCYTNRISIFGATQNVSAISSPTDHKRPGWGLQFLSSPTPSLSPNRSSISSFAFDFASRTVLFCFRVHLKTNNYRRPFPCRS